MSDKTDRGELVHVEVKMPGSDEGFYFYKNLVWSEGVAILKNLDDGGQFAYEGLPDVVIAVARDKDGKRLYRPRDANRIENMYLEEVIRVVQELKPLFDSATTALEKKD